MSRTHRLCVGADILSSDAIKLIRFIRGSRSRSFFPPVTDPRRNYRCNYYILPVVSVRERKDLRKQNAHAVYYMHVRMVRGEKVFRRRVVSKRGTTRNQRPVFFCTRRRCFRAVVTTIICQITDWPHRIDVCRSGGFLRKRGEKRKERRRGDQKGRKEDNTACTSYRAALSENLLARCDRQLRCLATRAKQRVLAGFISPRIFK